MRILFSNDQPILTYADLAKAIAQMTPDQLQCPVFIDVGGEISPVDGEIREADDDEIDVAYANSHPVLTVSSL